MQYKSLYPGSRDTFENHGSKDGIGLDIDWQKSDELSSEELDLITDAILQLEAIIGVTTFLGLTDVPASYAGQAGKIAKVNDAENILEFDLHRQFDNLCRNAAFASRSQGTAKEPDEWTQEGTPTVAYAAVDTGYGDHAVKLTATGAGDEGIKITLTHLKPSAKYQVFARAKVDAGDTASLITTGAGTNINVDSTSAAWEDIEGEFITDAGATDVVIKLVASAATDVAYFCGITCVEGDIPPGNFIRRVNETIWLPAPLTSASWNGDSFSDAEANLDLSAVFGCPPGIKAVLLGWTMNDEDVTATTYLVFAPKDYDPPLGQNLNAGGMTIKGLGDDISYIGQTWVPCIDGDIRYKIVASGVNTMDIYLRVWGYVLGG